ncbi:Major facilitator superfamily [Neofusicoccum parvum]|uniref:Major facilitator superfamily n=1 Tax=Neofusicoccum parvum TaxID=310453 RepID=A0ACB5SMT5_9PEZI|nr:Major facilitator superfamily [Neofusicoccum parvum]
MLKSASNLQPDTEQRLNLGLHLFDVNYRGDRIIYEVGLEEALAHYAGNDPIQSGTAYLDSTYEMGGNSMPLVPGYDCPAYATYLSSPFNRNSICLFESTADYPIQRHISGAYVSVTKNTYFTIRHISTIGNYDYLFSYSFYMDVSLRLDVRASGYIQTAYYAHNTEYGYQIHDALSGSMHDHVINFKLDLDVLGTRNTLTNTTFTPSIETYPWSKTPRNTMKLVRSTVASEDEGKLSWGENRATQWAVVNTDETLFGNPRGYKIIPDGAVHLTIKNSSNLANAANWAEHDFFVTKQKDTEPRAGHPRNVQDVHNPVVDFAKFFDGESLVQEDLVLWVNLGMHHVPHTGDLPNTVFTTAHSGLHIAPLNYLPGDPSRETVNMCLVLCIAARVPRTILTPSPLFAPAPALPMSEPGIDTATPAQDPLGNLEKQSQDVVLNETSSNAPSAPAPPPAPNGGFKAWTQVAAGHLVIFNCWGYLSSFGLFQSHYTTTLSATPSAISWIGSVQILLIYLTGTFSGRALDAGHFLPTVLLGSLLQTAGVLLTSACTQYWQLFLAQGLCKGLGDGLVFCPTVALVATYFSTRRALAISAAATGGATGGVVFPLMARQLLPTVGFGWTVRAMGLVVALNAAVFLAVARVRVAPRSAGPLVEWGAFAEPAFGLFCAGMFLNLWAVFFAYFYVSSFARGVLGVGEGTSLTLLLVLNAVGVPARLGGGLVADRVGPVNALIPAVFLAGVLVYCWAAVSSLGAMYVFCVLYGVFGGAIQSLFPAACASLTTDLKKMGVRTGMCFSVVSVACLTGPPIAGALIQRHDGGYLISQNGLEWKTKM